jgi:hypothetical protein
MPKRILLSNKTRSLEVIKADLNEAGKVVRVAVKNVSNKNIDWFRISLGADSAIEADFTLAEKSVLAAGEIYEDEYPFDTSSDQVPITIVSVLFEDSVSDGDAYYAQLLKAKRSGENMELSRVVPLLRQATEDSTTHQASLVLRNLETDVWDARNENRAREAELDLQAEARLIGIQTIRQRVQRDIEQIKAMKANGDWRDTKQQLKSVNERYDKIRENLKRYNF